MTRSKKFRPWFSRLGVLLVAGLLVFAGVGCDGSDSSFTPSGPETQIGVFADAPVDGIEYETETQSGVTTNGGEFFYLEGETVTFFIGGIVIGTCPAEPVVTPVDLVEDAVDETHPTVINIVRFLITLDENEDLDDGIGVTDEMIDAASDLSLTFDMTVAAFETDHSVQVVVSTLTSFRGDRRPRGLLRAITAQLHLRQTLANLTIYVDNDGDGLSEWDGDCDDEDAETQDGCPPGPVASEPLDNGYIVDFMGVEYNDDGTSTWHYTVRETEDAQDLSNWVLELPGCVLEGDIVYTPADGAEIVDPDPIAGFSGVKWNTNDDDFEEGDFSITVDGHWDTTTVQVAAKGPEMAAGEIDGPFCSEVTPADGDSDGYTPDQGDEDDTDPNVYPGAPEICGDGIDQDLDDFDAVCAEEGVFLLGSQGVIGLEYQTFSVEGVASISGVTDEDGRFEYLPGEEIAFFIGDIELGRIEARAVITPIMLVPGGTVETSAVVHIAQLLMTLDDDDDPDNGVSIAAAVHAAAIGVSIDFELEDPFEALLGLILDLTAARGCGESRPLVISIRVEAALDETEDTENDLTADDDGDGYRAAVDCNDDDADIHPDADEVCDDEIDHNCDGSASCVEVSETVVLANGFEITFTGVEYHNDGSSTWEYRVAELQCAQDLSNWVLELPDCDDVDALGHLEILGASPEPNEAVHPDPNADLYGIKWETGTGFNAGGFSVTVMGHWSVGVVDVAAKGPDVAYGRIAGPVCEVYEVVDADADGWPADVDCDDNNPDVHPMAQEILGNDIDENCDGEAPAEDFLPLDGNWKTPADVDGPFIRFTVKGDEVKTLLLKVDDDCAGSNVVTAGNARLEIEDNEFEYAIGDFELMGAFDSETEASGKYFTTSACGDELSVDWVAERVSSDEDLVDDDGDGYSEEEGDADDSDPDVNPEAEEVCGNDIDEDGDGVIAVCPDGTALEGYFIFGGGVVGIGYRTETLEGVTDEEGLFYFHEGEEITFFIGDLVLGTVTPVVDPTLESVVVRPVDFFMTTDQSAVAVINFCRVLLSLDADNDPVNGIFVPAVVRIMAVDIELDFSVDVVLFEEDFAEWIILLSQYRPAGPSELPFPFLVAFVFDMTEGYFLDNDGDGFSEFFGDCDDENPEIYPGSGLTCDDGPPVEEIMEGDWAGRTNQEQAVTFRLENGQISELQVLLNFDEVNSGDCEESNLLVTDGIDIPVTENRFSFSTGQVEFKGEFTSATEAEGTWFYENEGCGAGRGDWTASISAETADADNDGVTFADGDRVDDDPTIYPGAEEVCGDGIDQDLNDSDLICVDLTDDEVTGNWSLGLTLVNVPANAEYEAVYVTVKEIQVHTRAGWRILGSPKTTYALFDLTNETVEILAEGKLQSGFDGEYNEIRLILAEEPFVPSGAEEDYAHYIIDRDGEMHELDVPSGSTTGIKIKHRFTIRKDGDTDLIIYLDAIKSIKKTANGWKMKPTFRVMECDDCEDDEDEDEEDEEDDDDRRRSLDNLGGIV